MGQLMWWELTMTLTYQMSVSMLNAMAVMDEGGVKGVQKTKLASHAVEKEVVEGEKEVEEKEVEVEEEEEKSADLGHGLEKDGQLGHLEEVEGANPGNLIKQPLLMKVVVVHLKVIDGGVQTVHLEEILSGIALGVSGDHLPKVLVAALAMVALALSTQKTLAVQSLVVRVAVVTVRVNSVHPKNASRKSTDIGR